MNDNRICILKKREILLMFSLLLSSGLQSSCASPSYSLWIPDKQETTRDLSGSGVPVFTQSPGERARSAGAENSSIQTPVGDKSRKPGERLVKEGIAVEFTIDPVSEKNDKAGEVLAGEDSIVHFSIKDATGIPLTGLRPSVWMDLRQPGKAADDNQCREKIRSFLQAGLSARPMIDLNTYYVLTLNDEANISVIDPLLGYGGSKLLTLILLKEPGEDWVLKTTPPLLFVTMPRANQVAVIDTRTWKVISTIDSGWNPRRAALQPDGKYLWVLNDGSERHENESGVTVVDTDHLRVVAQIRTGMGHHEVSFTDDSRYAYVTNQQDGTLSIIDVRGLVLTMTLKTGSRPSSVAFSPLSKLIYVTHEGDGTIAVVDGAKHDIVNRIAAQPGLGTIRFAPESRWGFVANVRTNQVQIIDSSSNRIAHTIEVGKGPDQISFTRTFAYIRMTGSEEVKMIQLAGLGRPGSLPVLDFPGGQAAPEKASPVGIGQAIVPAPEGNSVYVANPADKVVYYYEEGMAAPMGNLQNYRRSPKAVLVIDRSIRESSPGTYSGQVKLGVSGTYDVAFLLDSPRIAHCFELPVSPKSNQERQGPALRIETELKERRVAAGQPFQLRFKLTDPMTSLPKAELKDVNVLGFLAPGTWQKRLWAQSVGEGLYEVVLTPPQPGIYYFFFACPSLGVGFNDFPFLTLQAFDEKGTAPAKVAQGDSKK